jgi:hypothetical protein
MSIRALFIFNSILSLFFGCAFVLVPEFSISFYGITLGDGGILMARLMGAAFLSFTGITWFARNSEESEARRAIVLGLFISFAIGFVVSLMAQLSGIVNELGWSTVAIYLLLSLGYGYFQFVKKISS